MSEHTRDDAPELLTSTEAADLLRAPVATLRYWRHLGTGPRSFRLGRRVLYRRDDLHAWIDAQHAEAVDRPPPSGRTSSAIACGASPHVSAHS
ncbi:DNA binding domain-containing protein, excisionase family [Modestobacter sp. DSM 44400]|uniref:helix-turn-helix transcriptional regulator n=1 Tax=Modestobacter sp. DSM 44400 TaxID=1550230 RepID=UPI00089754AF|nr:helix-turn-helix domain-containing protein [Modestobacter sp. DSM 44400]SDY90776.1 DNA binding domain-containing protein, excisionase family [Modestobacter sp. DSM 44400]